MQSTGQYGVTDSPQFLVARAAPPHMFSITHDNISLSPPTSHPHSHPGHHHHGLPHHLQQQAQQAQHQHHHYAAHLAHQTHATLQAQAHQQIHQVSHHAQHLQHAQHSQHTLAHLQQQAQQQQQQAQQQPAAPHQDVPSQHQLQQQVQQAQQQAQQQQQHQAQQQHHEEQQKQQQQQQQQHAQEQMVQQLGLGDPDSPEVPSPIACRPSPTNYSKLLMSAQQDDEGLEEEGRSSGGNRWPRAETLALIHIRSEMDANFRDSGVKGPLWEDVSRKLAEQGYHRSGKKCKEKFENIHKYYKKSKDGRAGRQDGKSYRFFAQLDALFGGQQTSTQVETDTAAAVLLIGAGPPLGVSPGEDLNRPSEVSTAVTLSKSSDDDYDGPGSGLCDNQEKKSKSKKRKLLEGKSAETPKLDYFEAMMKSLVDKQEVMQRKFFEAMEKIEMERQAKEETWRRQEVARWTREHELRVQEHALAAQRDAALISFLQKVTGQTVQLPKFATSLRDPVAPSSRDSEE